MSTQAQNSRYGTHQMMFDQSMRQRTRPAPHAIASHPIQGGRNRVAAMTQPQQTANNG